MIHEERVFQPSSFSMVPVPRLAECGVKKDGKTDRPCRPSAKHEQVCERIIRHIRPQNHSTTIQTLRFWKNSPRVQCLHASHLHFHDADCGVCTLREDTSNETGESFVREGLVFTTDMDGTPGPWVELTCVLVWEGVNIA
jgi:hypothetical protein